MRFTDYAGEKIRTLFPSAPDLHGAWVDTEKRREIIDRLAERGIDFDQLAAAANQPDADPFDLLCHLAYNAPLRTRRERAERLRSNRKEPLFSCDGLTGFRNDTGGYRIRPGACKLSLRYLPAASLAQLLDPFSRLLLSPAGLNINAGGMVGQPESLAKLG